MYLTISFHSICALSIIIYVWITQDMRTQAITSTVTGINFTILGLLFAIVGIRSLQRLKKYFYSFYKENLCIIYSATMGLSLPLLVRGIVDTVRGLD